MAVTYLVCKQLQTYMKGKVLCSKWQAHTETPCTVHKCVVYASGLRVTAVEIFWRHYNRVCAGLKQ